MGKFGWDYPPGCHSLPWDEDEDERCAIERWLERWFGTAWNFKQHYIQRSQSRDKTSWTFRFTLLWVYSLYFHWHNRHSFNLKLSLLKAGQWCCLDEQEAQLTFEVNATTDITLNCFVDVTLSASLPPLEEQAVKRQNRDSDLFAPPIKPLWQYKLVTEKWKGE